MTVSPEVARAITLPDGYNWWADPRGGSGTLSALIILAMIAMVGYHLFQTIQVAVTEK